MSKNLNERSTAVFAPEPDTQAIQNLESMLAKAHPKLVGVDGEEIALPDAVYHVLQQVVHMMASGHAVSLLPYDHYLTSQEAADLLNVSRPYLYTLLDKQIIPFIKVGTHRRIRLEDLMAYKRQRDGQRRQSLSKLVTMSQDMGFYDIETTPVSDENLVAE